jgi:neutral ceramidase
MLRIGVEKIDITPPAGLHLAGYPNIKNIGGAPNSHKSEDGYVPRTTGAIGMNDPLYAKILAISNHEQTVVIVSLDLCVVVNQFTKKVRDIVHRLTDLPKEAIMLAATHTHSGPDIFTIFDPVDSFYAEKLACEVAEAIAKALDHMVAVNLKTGKASIEDYIINRVDNTGVVDSDLSILRFEAPTGQIEAIIVNASIHPIILSSESLVYSKDVVGIICDTLEHVYPDSVCLFLNGAAGNINPVGFPFNPKQDIVKQHKQLKKIGKKSPRTFDYTRLLGRLIASEGIKACEISTLVEEVTITFHRKELEIPLREKQERKNFCEFMNIQEPLKSELINSDTISSEIQLFSLGPIDCLALPGEPFTETGLALKQMMKGPVQLVIGFANSDPRYLPTDKAFENNHYETFGTPVKAGVEQIILESCKELLNRTNTIRKA